MPPMTAERRSTALRWAAYLALAALFAVACFFLSQWQFDRNHQRTAELALVGRNYDAEPVPLSDLVTGTDDFNPDDEWRPVTVRGVYLSDDQVLARNRPRGGTSAFEVLVPLRLEDGRILIVDRGWVPPGKGTVPDDVPPAPEGEVSVTVRMREGEALPSSGRTAPDGQVPTIHLPSVAETSGAATIVSAYGLMVNENPAPQDRPRALDAPTEDPGPHLSYAIQWILFALMGFIFIGYIIRTEVRYRREDEEARAEDRPPRASIRARKRDRDMDDEDAILDAAGR